MGTLRMRDLVQATGVTARSVRFYVEQGLLPPPEGRGTGAVYTEQHLLRLRVVRRLRAERVPIYLIRERLRKMPSDELARLGAPPATSSAAKAAAPGSAPISPGATAGAAGAATATAGASSAAATADGVARKYPAERWERIALLPGLELHIRADATPLIRRLADEIHARYGTAAGPPASL